MNTDKKIPRKRILHLITGLEVGGTENQLLKILPGLQNDFDNRVCCIVGHGPVGKRLEEKNIRVYYLGLRSAFNVGIIWKFRRIIKEYQPDALSTYLIHADLFGRIFGRLFGVKRIVCNQRGSLLQWKFLRFFDKLTKFLVTKYTIQTNHAKKELTEKLNLPAEKFEIIPNCVDLPEYEFEIDEKEKKLQLGINPDNLNIVCVGNLRKGKGHKYLLEAFEDVHKKIKNINLLIVGGGGEEEKLKKQIKIYNSASNIHFLGNRNDIREILRISDVFILPTLAEGMSNAILEAMASGLPVITTNIPSNLELIENEKSGILVPPGHHRAIANAMSRLINSYDDRMAMGKLAFIRCRDYFSSEQTIKRLKSLYNSMA